MPDITVQRHGDRWAVVEGGSAFAEYETREAAESAARARADGGTVDVREGDPSGLEQAAAEPEQTVTDEATGVDARERARSTQSGLYSLIFRATRRQEGCHVLAGNDRGGS